MCEDRRCRSPATFRLWQTGVDRSREFKCVYPSPCWADPRDNKVKMSAKWHYCCPLYPWPHDTHITTEVHFLGLYYDISCHWWFHICLTLFYFYDKLIARCTCLLKYVQKMSQLDAMEKYIYNKPGFDDLTYQFSEVCVSLIEIVSSYLSSVWNSAIRCRF